MKFEVIVKFSIPLMYDEKNMATIRIIESPSKQQARDIIEPQLLNFAQKGLGCICGQCYTRPLKSISYQIWETSR